MAKVSVSRRAVSGIIFIVAGALVVLAAILPLLGVAVPWLGALAYVGHRRRARACSASAR